MNKAKPEPIKGPFEQIVSRNSSVDFVVYTQHT